MVARSLKGAIVYPKLCTNGVHCGIFFSVKYSPLVKLMPHLAPGKKKFQVWPPRLVPIGIEPNLYRSAPTSSSVEPAERLGGQTGADVNKFDSILFGADFEGQICK